MIRLKSLYLLHLFLIILLLMIELVSSTAHRKMQNDITNLDADRSFVHSSIDPQLNRERLEFLPSFLLKLTETPHYALNNFSVHTAEDYCWNIEYSGSFCEEAAQDYTLILFVKQPYYNMSTNTVDYLSINYLHINILSTELYEEGVNNDTYVIKYVLNNTQLNGNTYQYEIQDGLFYTAYYVFQKGSKRVSSETVISQDGTRFNQAQFHETDLAQLCFTITQYACPVGSVYQNYSSYEECLQVMQAIDAQNRASYECPDLQVSNTTSCRLLHAVVALTEPPLSQDIHCPHAATPSTHCIDYCRERCDRCDLNAHCTFSVNPYGVRSYQCECNEGWIGNGESCARSNCSHTYECANNGNNYNYVSCNASSNLCGCRESFVWNATSGVCECGGNNSVWWIDGTPQCLPLGRCIDRVQCASQGYNSEGVLQNAIGNWNQVQCVPYGPLTTLFPHNTCVCNYGYEGGFFLPCTCPLTEIWSPTLQANVCIDTNVECVDDYSCPANLVCNKRRGPSNGVGLCERRNDDKGNNKENDDKGNNKGNVNDKMNAILS